MKTKRRFVIMICPNCGSENVTISMQQVSSKTKKSGVGFGGHMNNAARGLTAMCTLGLSNLVWKKSTGTAKEVVKNQKMCLCQNCGNSWPIKWISSAAGIGSTAPASRRLHLRRRRRAWALPWCSRGSDCERPWKAPRLRWCLLSRFQNEYWCSAFGVPPYFRTFVQ